MWSLNLQLKCNTLHLNGIGNTSSPLTPCYNLDHVIVHCLYIDHLVCIVCYRIEVEPEPEITPSVEDTVYDPLIMSIKSHFPLSLTYALFRMITMIRFYRIDEPIPLHDLSFVIVVSKP